MQSKIRKNIYKNVEQGKQNSKEDNAVMGCQQNKRRIEIFGYADRILFENKDFPTNIRIFYYSSENVILFQA